ncbi:MAG: hypothetical protein QG567_1374, partial [Campylobacterota bacterium]|nr:hypothetical protein [Campylobacterota bacterium]
TWYCNPKKKFVCRSSCAIKNIELSELPLLKKVAERVRRDMELRSA